MTSPTCAAPSTRARTTASSAEARPLRDPGTGEVLGYEANYVGNLEFVREGESRPGAQGGVDIVPATFRVNSVRQEANVGDRLAPVPPKDFSNYAPRAPEGEIAGQIVSIYGDALTAGQNQIVALNRGEREGLQRGHVLALWRAGDRVVDKTDAARTPAEAARRAPWPAVRVPHLRAHVLCADPPGAGAGAARRPLHPALTAVPAVQPGRRPGPPGALTAR